MEGFQDHEDPTPLVIAIFGNSIPELPQFLSILQLKKCYNKYHLYFFSPKFPYNIWGGIFPMPWKYRQSADFLSTFYCKFDVLFGNYKIYVDILVGFQYTQVENTKKNQKYTLGLIFGHHYSVNLMYFKEIYNILGRNWYTHVEDT